MQQTRMAMDSPREDALDAGVEPLPPGPVTWSPEATARLEGVPRFVRGMVKRIYSEYAREQDISVITPAVMDQARSDMGMEGM